MITRHELNPHNFPLTEKQEANQADLHRKINIVRDKDHYGKPMVVTNGVRTWKYHVKIYQQLYPTLQPPKASAHLTENGDGTEGAASACDIADVDGSLAAWCLTNVTKLKKIGLYIEDPSMTKGRVHFQSTPPASGNTVFLPGLKPKKK